MNKLSLFGWAFAIIMCFSLFLFSSCGDDVVNNNIINTGENQKVFSVYPSELQMLADENCSVEFSIVSDKEWNIYGVPDWLKLSATSGRSDAKIFVSSRTKNSGDTERTATLSVVSNGTKFTVVIIQQKEEVVGATSPIVGIWKSSWDDGFCQLTFNADGSGTYYEYDISDKTGEVDEWEESCFYQYDENTAKLTFWWLSESGELGDKEVANLEWINPNAFIADHLMDLESLWIKQNK